MGVFPKEDHMNGKAKACKRALIPKNSYLLTSLPDGKAKACKRALIQVMLALPVALTFMEKQKLVKEH